MSLDAFLDPPAELWPIPFAAATDSAPCWTAVDGTSLATRYPAQCLQLVMVAPHRRVPAALAAQCLAAFAVEWDGGTPAHRTLRSWQRIPLAEAVRGKGQKRFLLRLSAASGWDALEPAAMRAQPRSGPTEVASGVQVVQPALALAGGESGMPWHSAMPVHYAVATGRDLWHDLPLLFVDGPEDRLARRLMHRVWNRTLGYSFGRMALDWQQDTAGTPSAPTLHLPLWPAKDLGESMERYCGSTGALQRLKDQPLLQIDSADADAMPRLALMEMVSVARQLGRPAAALLDGTALASPKLPSLLAELLAAGVSRFLIGDGGARQGTAPAEALALPTALARCAALASAGRPQVDVLILHPAETVASEWRRPALRLNGAGELRPEKPNPAGRHQARRVDKQLQRLMDGVRDAGCDADLGDEDLIETFGNALEAHYIIGEMRYPVVVLPEAASWRHKTVCFLEHFVKQGGCVLLAGDAPTEVDGVAAAERWADLLGGSGVQRLDPTPHAMRKGIAAACPSRPRVRRARRSRGAGAALATPQLRVRVLEDGRHLYLVANVELVGGQADTLLALDSVDTALTCLEPMHGTCLPIANAGDANTTNTANTESRSLVFPAAPGSLIGFLEGEVAAPIAADSPARGAASITLPGF